MVCRTSSKSESAQIFINFMRNAWWLGQTDTVSPMMIGVIALALWSVFWTGLSLWRAAKRGDKGWFVFFLVVHTAGVVEFLYLFFVARIFEHKASKKSSRRLR